MVWLGAVPGLRWAEMAGLTVGSLDLLRNSVTVRHQLAATASSASPSPRPVDASCRAPRSSPRPCRPHGRQPAHWSRTSPAALHHPAGLAPRLLATGSCGSGSRQSPGPASRGAGFHDLCRANATTLVAEGVNVKTAQIRPGYADPRTTLSVYARAVPPADGAAADVLGRTFFLGSRTARARNA
jgi:hypothetical protein